MNSSQQFQRFFMTSPKLTNYLRMYRRRIGLSQSEVAFLLGCQDGAKVSRYERLSRQPNLDTVLAYKVVFRVPLNELCAGKFQKVEETIHERAHLLAERLSAEKPDRTTEQKLEFLRALSSGAEAWPNNDGLHFA